MKSHWFRYVIVAAFACVLGALAHASISRAMQSRDAEQPQSVNQTPTPPPDDLEIPGLETRLTSQSAGDRSAGNKKLQNALLQKLWDVIDAADDLSSNEKSEARTILEEADPVLARIKKDNERAIQILRTPPRRVVPQRPASTANTEQPKTTAKSSAEEHDGNN